MDAKTIVFDRFITPCLGKRTGVVGVELEFPLLNQSKAPVDVEVAMGLLADCNQKGFHTVEQTVSGTPAFVENGDGDVISFDNSYNNLEFSMGYGGDLMAMEARFRKLFAQAMAYLGPKGYLIAGMGVNPYKAYITQSPVDYPVYQMVDKFLHTYAGKDCHHVPDFPAYISSVQTHLDISPGDLPRTATLFAQLDFVRALLFANSPDFSGQNLLCARDYYWEHSAFGTLAKNTGGVDEAYHSIDDMAMSFLDRSLFHRLRDGAYEIFDPVSLQDYFGQPAYGAQPQDIQQFLSFRNVELTYRGTLEVRGDCAQPLSAAFAPPAFSLGLACNATVAAELTQAFLARWGAGRTNSQLRAAVAATGELPGVPAEELYTFAGQLLSAAQQGLTQRGKGEEVLLQPLYERVERRTNPAKQWRRMQQQGAADKEIIDIWNKIK